MQGVSVLGAARAVVVAAVLAGLGGCGYSVRPPFDTGIKTVYVPMARSLSYRRDLNKMITERLIKEIEQRTPFKVVGSPEGADATLELTVLYDDKSVMVENPNNLPRQLQALITVEARFLDNRPGADQSAMPAVVFSDQAYFYPELGETSVAGFTKAIDNLVRQIVSMMEQPWSSRDTPFLPPEPDEDEVRPARR
jgi:hypothetical protein